MIKGLPDKIRTQRENIGLSQKELASKLMVSPALISAYENGIRTPSAEVLLSLSYSLKVSVDWLLGKSDGDRTVIDVTGLTPEQITALSTLIGTMQKND